jgi:hypothetical protein
MRMRWAGHVAYMGARRNAYRVLEGNTTGKRSSGIHISEDNIKIHLRENRWDGMDWINLANNMDRWQALGDPAINLGVL